MGACGPARPTIGPALLGSYAAARAAVVLHQLQLLLLPEEGLPGKVVERIPLQEACCSASALQGGRGLLPPHGSMRHRTGGMPMPPTLSCHPLGSHISGDASGCGAGPTPPRQ
jgi:hypothetical protein